MPFPDSSFDADVLDPPYLDRDTAYQHADYGVGSTSELRTLAGIRSFYLSGACEAYRLLRTKGILILKCQDSGTTWNHVDFMKLPGFECIDVFVLVQSGRPPWDPKWKQQHHARKNHSYFIVLKKSSQARTGTKKQQRTQLKG